MSSIQIQLVGVRPFPPASYFGQLSLHVLARGLITFYEKYQIPLSFPCAHLVPYVLTRYRSIAMYYKLYASLLNIQWCPPLTSSMAYPIQCFGVRKLSPSQGSVFLHCQPFPLLLVKLFPLLPGDRVYFKKSQFYDLYCIYYLIFCACDQRKMKTNRINNREYSWGHRNISYTNRIDVFNQDKFFHKLQ